MNTQQIESTRILRLINVPGDSKNDSYKKELMYIVSTQRLLLLLHDVTTLLWLRKIWTFSRGFNFGISPRVLIFAHPYQFILKHSKFFVKIRFLYHFFTIPISNYFARIYFRALPYCAWIFGLIFAHLASLREFER